MKASAIKKTFDSYQAIESKSLLNDLRVRFIGLGLIQSTIIPISAGLEECVLAMDELIGISHFLGICSSIYLVQSVPIPANRIE